jgi:hypothetical protein
MCRSHTIAAVGVLLDQGEVFLGSDHWTRVAGQSHHRKDAEHSVDSASLKAQVAEMRAVEEGAGRREQFGGRVSTLRNRCHTRPVVGPPLLWWLLTSRLEL